MGWVLVRMFGLGAVAVPAGYLLWAGAARWIGGDGTGAGGRVFGVVEAKAAGPAVGGCEVFPADNVWNTPVDKLPADPKSGAYINSIGTFTTLHADFGSDLFSGIPFALLPPNTAQVHVTFQYADESDPGTYPIPRNPAIEGGPKATGDRHILLVDPQHCVLYELFDMHPQPGGGWKGGSGVKWDLHSNKLRPEGWGSADAAGLPILPGLVRYDEVASGEIRHALRFTIPHTQNKWVWPGRHRASRISDANVAPMGERFRLRADYNISGFSKPNQVILTALKRYGMFLSDNGSAVFLSGAPDKRWNDADLQQLRQVRAGDFEAVDESRWAAKDSARVDPALVR